MFSAILHRFRRDWSPVEFVRPGGYGEIWKITWPLIIMNASNTVMLLCNRAFLAHNQLEDVTAAVTAGQLFFCANSFFLITTSFTGAIVAQHFGNKDRVNCIHSVWNGFYFGCMVSLILAFILPVIGHFVFQLGTVSEEIKTREVEYFLTLIPGGMFVCMEAPFLSFFTATGRTKIVAAIKISTMLVSVPLNYIMIFGKCGLPAMGITGAALAASTAMFCSFLISLSVFLCQNQTQWESRSHRKLDFAILKKLLFFGAPGGMGACIRSAAFASVLMFFGFLGDISLTAATLAMTINNLAFIPLLGLMDSTSVITGKYIGERKLSVADRISGRSMRLLAIYMTAIGILYFFFPDFLVRFFAPSKESGVKFSDVIDDVKLILLFQFVQNYFDGLRFIVSGSLRGAGDTRIPLLLSLGTSWLIQVPAAALVSIVFPQPIWSAWAWSISFYVIVDAVIIQIRKKTGAWKKIKVIDLPPAEEAEA